jgi:hypothetical protein
MDRTTKQEEFDNQVQDFMERHPNYSTPGASSHWFKIKVGYVLLAIGSILGIWAVSNRNDVNLRRDINRLGVSSCLSSIKTYGKFNDQIETQIETQREGLAINLERGDKQRAAINRSAIKRLTRDKIVPPTPKVCQELQILK